MSQSQASRREFLLYWVGVFVVALSIAAVLTATSTVVTDVLSYNCYVPAFSEMMGMTRPTTPPIRPPNATTVVGDGIGQQYPNIPYPYYCPSPAVPVIRFVFSLLSSLVFVGVGVYMVASGKKK